MPNVTDYDENGELLNPEYWDSPPDYRTTKERIHDYFDPACKQPLSGFDIYHSWLFYPPIIRTFDDAKDLLDEIIEGQVDRMVNVFRGDMPTQEIRAFTRVYMTEFKVIERQRDVINRFCQEGKTGRWTRYKERKKIRKELGEAVQEEGLLKEKAEYVIEFCVESTYRFKVRSNMNIDDLFDYYCVDHMGTFIMDTDVFEEKVKSGEAKLYSEAEVRVPEESLSIMEVVDNNHIVTSRMF